MGPRSRNAFARRAQVIANELDGKLLGDVPAAIAILDRFLHRAKILEVTGRGYRSTIAMKLQKGPRTRNSCQFKQAGDFEATTGGPY